MKNCLSFFIQLLILSFDNSISNNTLRIVADAQRIKEGCYDSKPITCNNNYINTPKKNSLVPSGDSLNYDLDFIDMAENVCLRLVTEVFPNDEVVWDITQHKDYLNSIFSNTEFCKDIHTYYSHCLFCAASQNLDNRWICQDGYRHTQCGNQLSEAEILSTDNEDENAVEYAQYKTKNDIDQTCALIEKSYETVWVRDFDYALPTTIDLCIRQSQIKHLCPGYCSGTCFDEIIHPPSCSIDSMSSIPANTTNSTNNNNSSNATIISTNIYNNHSDTTTSDIDYFTVCKQINLRAFHGVDINVILNTSTHIDFLRVVHVDDPFCEVAQEAYPYCYWCYPSDSRCFNEDDWPTSCEDPLLNEDAMQSITIVDKEIVDTINYNRICEELLIAFDDVAFEDEMNIKKHNFRIPDNNEFCDIARLSYHKCFWCAAAHAPNDEVTPDDFCLPNTACETTIRVPKWFVSSTLEKMNIDIFDQFLLHDKTLPCKEIYEFWSNEWTDPFSLEACYEDIFLSRLCPNEFCNSTPDAKSIDDNYLGAKTLLQKRLLIWISRLSAILSFFGGSYILCDTIYKVTIARSAISSSSNTNSNNIHRSRNTQILVYKQLIFGMAIFDIITALAWVFATAPIDKEEVSYVEGVIGNKITCSAQAFFIQLGFTSIYYNVSLSLYYVFVLVFNWREDQLQRASKYLHIVPVGLGLGLSFGAIPVYHWFEYGCHLLPPPDGDLWVVLVFVVIPLGFSIIAITLSMLLVYCKVREQSAASRKWNLDTTDITVVRQQQELRSSIVSCQQPSSSVSRPDTATTTISSSHSRTRSAPRTGTTNPATKRIEKAVFWQCVCYVLAFYITWPILFSVYLASVDVDGPLGLTLTVAFVAPLQGFSNFLVYIRPKLMKIFCKSGKKKQQRQVGEDDDEGEQQHQEEGPQPKLSSGRVSRDYGDENHIEMQEFSTALDGNRIADHAADSEEVLAPPT